MEVMTGAGHIELSWDPKVPAEVRKARAEYARLRKEGYVFFSVPRRGGTPEKVEAFDARARKLGVRTSRRTVAVPRMRGG